METTDSYHRPVLVDEAIGYLITRRDGVYIDATAGGGSHMLAILSQLQSSGRVLAIDRDEEAIDATRQRVSRFASQVALAQGEFASLKELGFDAGIMRVNGVLFDLGISSHQLDRSDRGFSYRSSGPLDFRMDRRAPITAADVINDSSADRLARIFFEYGGEKNARKIARAVVEARRQKPLATTDELAAVIASVTNPRYLNKTLSRTYQAIRLVVNDELNQLSAGLAAAYDLLDEFGRLVVISYHSLEDRIVKNFIRDKKPRTTGETAHGLRPLTRKPVTASDDEIRMNPRAHSARLRAAEKI
jgi:16S rRNA (cytosine1402-N4)-methyltransferase